LPGANETAFFAVSSVGKLYAAVADGATAMSIEGGRVGSDFRGDGNGAALKESFIAAGVGDDLDGWIDFAIAFDEAPDGAR